jgi:DNA polymerase-3 subunit gamma/tau
VARLAAEGYELSHFVGEFTRYVRNLTIAKTCGAESALLQVPSDERKALGELSGLFSEEDLTRFFQILLRTESEMRYSLEPRFQLEMGLLKLTHAARLAPLETLLAQLANGPRPEKTGGAPSRAGAPSSAPARSPMKAQESAAVSTAVPRPAANPRPVPAASPAARSVAIAAPAAGAAEDARLGAIKSLLFDRSNKLLSSCLEHVSAFRLEDGEVRFLFPRDASFYADLVRSRERLDALREVCAQVLGQPVRICVTLVEPEGSRAAARPSARERAARDPGVEAFRKRFDGILLDAQDLTEE